MNEKPALRQIPDDELTTRCMSFSRHGDNTCHSPRDGVQIVTVQESPSHTPGVFLVQCGEGCRYAFKINLVEMYFNAQGRKIDATDHIVAR